MSRSVRSSIALALLILLLAPAARAAVPVEFSGGSGAPLSFTLPQAVEYTITQSFPPFFGPNFVFDGVGNIFNGLFPPVTGTITFAINGGTPQTIQFLNSGIGVDSISPEDIYTWPSVVQDVPIGAVVTLSAGTLTTTTNIAAAAPADGSFDTWMTGSNGFTISTFGESVPEPASLSLLVVAAAAMRRRN